MRRTVGCRLHKGDG